MPDPSWTSIAGLDLASAAFPARARIGDDTVFVFRVGDGFQAVQRACPHQEASLGEAVVLNDGRWLRCALHGYTFKLSDGKGVNCPGYRIKVYEVTAAPDGLYARAVW